MSEILLSVLIPTVVGREKDADRLKSKILKSSGALKDPSEGISALKDKNASGWTDELGMNGLILPELQIEIIEFKDDKQISIGEKRELLYKKAKGLYSWQIDDDDSISDDAITIILRAVKSHPTIPCITFRENCMMNGEYYSSNHSIKYDKWQDIFDGYDFTRTPFYKDVIRTDIAKSIPFPHVRYNEDEQWSMAIKHLLTDEIHIDKELYFYIYEPKESHNERYGIK